jgi:hypothetical protein
MWWGDDYRFQISDSARKILLFIIGLFMLLILFRLFSWGSIIFFFFFPVAFHYGNDWFGANGSQTEKRKREPETILIMPDDKPKRGESAPRYALGDDGELIEVDDRDQERRSADEPPRRAQDRDEHV